MRRSLFPLVALTGLCLAPSAAGAQEPRAEAHVRFERGVELFDEGHLDAALAEFQRAYDIAPTYRVLFNLGRVHQELGDAVQAVRFYRRYLEEGGRRVPTGRRRDVEDWLARLEQRIGTVSVEVNVEGATVSVDGADVGRAPLSERLLLAAGSHTLTVRAPGHTEERRSLQIAGGTEQSLELTLRPVRGSSLEVRSPVPGVQILVDGEVVGTTPLEGTLPITPGTYAVEGRRRGYETDRQRVSIAHDAEAVVELSLRRRRDLPATELGSLVLRIPDAPFALTVDGERLDGQRSLELPEGPHALFLEVSGREPVRAEVDVAPQATETFHPTLEWDSDARARRLESASTERLIGWLVAGGGLAIGAAAGAVAVGAFSRQSDLADQIAPLEEQVRGCDMGRECPLGLRDEYNALVEEHNNERTLAILSGVIAGVGIVPLVIGLTLVLGADSESDIDEAASAAAGRRLELGLGPGTLDLHGTF